MFTPEPGLIIWTVISFFTLFFLLAKFAYKPLIQVMEKREKIIWESLEVAKNTRQDAERLVEESRHELAEAKEKVKRGIEQGRIQGENIEKKIIEMANEEARNLIMRAQIEIKMEKEKALRELRSEIGSLTFDIASKVTQKSLDKKDHLRLMEDFIKEVDSLHEH